MPQVFADHHDSFLEDYLHHLESKVLNKDRLLFGKAKNGYIFPSFMYVRVSSSASKHVYLNKIIACILLFDSTCPVTSMGLNSSLQFELKNTSNSSAI